MAAQRNDLDLAGLRLAAGEGRRLHAEVTIAPLVLGIGKAAHARSGEGEDLDSPYVADEALDLAAWARDAFALAAPVKVLCRDDCAGLCPVCAADLNEAGPGHRHERAPDSRWAKLRELKLE